VDGNAAMGQNAEQMAKVMAAIKGAGIAEKDIQTSGINLSPQYRYVENEAPKITGFQASNTVNLKVRDIAKLGKVLDALAAQGSNQINGPSFEIDQPEPVYDEARLAALKLRLGRPEEVVVHADMALRLSPFEPALVGHSHLWAGIAEFYLEREDAAYERMRRSVAAGLSPTRGVLLWLASLAALQGNEALAAQHAAEVMQLEPGWSISRWRAVTVLTHPRLVAGRERFAEGMKKAGLPD
jgi:hypothetical protein